MLRHPPPSRLRTSVTVVALLALLLAACGGEDDDAGDAAGSPSERARPADGEPGESEAGEPEGGASEGGDADDDPGRPAASEGPAPSYEDHVPQQYAGTSGWICHPALADDPCRDLATTVIEPDGERRVEETAPTEDPRFDCFYVYPTTSADPGPVSDLTVDESELATVRAQVARYATACRVFAPAYRQITLTGLGGGAGQAERDQAFADVADAWRTYVVEENDGRGVVLLGHSQGAGHLRRLLAEELDDDAALRSLLVSAVLLGTTVAVPEGELVGGDLQEIPACTSAEDVGCVISYSSYPADAPPAPGAIFGRADDGQQALCVDPAQLAGVDGPVGAVVPARPGLLGGIPGVEDVGTPFVSLPASIVTRCENREGYSYLSVALAGTEDPRPVAGLVRQGLGPTWGLHLLDANLAQDVLIEIVSRQAEAHAGG